MDYVKKVNNLCLTGDLSENWRRFKQNYDIFEEAAGIKTQTENIRIASFLNTIGEEALELFNSFDMSVKDRKCYTKIQNAFEKHCTKKKRIVYERFKFFSRRQSESDSLKSFLTDLTKMAATCEFKDQEKSLIRDHFVSGIRDKDLQADLLRFEDDLNFDKIVELLELLNVAKQHCQQKNLAAGDDFDIIVTDEMLRIKQPTENVGSTEEGAIAVDEAKSKLVDPYYDDKACKRCNFRHNYRDCPAFGKKCLKCFQLHHFAVCCTVTTDNFKMPCKKCNLKHPFRNCPAFGRRCAFCQQMNHFAIYCPKRKAEC